jgi:hypothetical protein
MANHPNRSKAVRIIDSTYTGPDAACREDRAFQLARAQSDLNLASDMANDTGRSRIAAENRRVGQASIPAIKARIAALS